MTPLEITEYKRSWRADAWSTYIDPDADIWTKDWCRRHLEKKSWSFNPYAREDDWHKIMFEHEADLILFKADYNEKYRVKI